MPITIIHEFGGRPRKGRKLHFLQRHSHAFKTINKTRVFLKSRGLSTCKATTHYTP